MQVDISPPFDEGLPACEDYDLWLRVCADYPVLFLEDVEGQLFADLALTISIAVVISLVVALTVLPTVAGSWLKPKTQGKNESQSWSKLAHNLMKISSTGKRRAILIVSLISAPLLATWLLFPQMDYLPPVKRDAVDAFLQFPPGSNIETNEKEVISKALERCRWNKTETAKALGISFRALRYRLKKLELD